MLVTDAVLLLFSPSRMSDDIRVVTTNRKAFHDYHILDRFEAGLELAGTEVKSLREGRANLRDAYARIINGEVYLIGSHIGHYSHTGFSGHDPYRSRRLLLNKREIRKLDDPPAVGSLSQAVVEVDIISVRILEPGSDDHRVVR